MGDHNHASSVQGSNREQEEGYGWREELRFLKENLENKIEKIDRKFDDFRNELRKDMKEMFSLISLNKGKGIEK